MVKSKRWIGLRVADSVAGLRTGWRREASLRLHFSLAAIGLVLIVLVRPPLAWTLGFLILLVLSAAIELLNAAIEALLDRLHPDLDPNIGAAKDMASAAAFVVNVAAGLAGIAAIWAGLKG
jgi:diacylglycerol kinase (ATP)